MPLMLKPLFLVALLFMPAGKGVRFLPHADPFAADARMKARLTLRLRDTPLRDFLADLETQTGVRFFADSSVEDDRISLYAHDRPLAETLRAAAAFLRFEWKREGKPDDYAYSLYQTEAARRQEEIERDSLLSAAADRIMEEMAAYARLEKMTPEQAAARAAEIARQREQEKDAAKRRALAVEHAVCNQFLARPEWRIVLLFLRTLSRDRLLALLRAGTSDYAWPALIGYGEFPAPAAAELRQLRAGDETMGIAPFSFVRLHFLGETGPEPGLRWQMVMGRRAGYAYSTATFEGALPAAGDEEAEMETGEPLEPAGWRSDPALIAPVSLRLPADLRPTPNAQRSTPPTLGDALELLDRAHPADMIADAFWSTRMTGVNLNETPFGEALSRLARLTRHRWWKQDGFVMVQSRAYAADRSAEPPATAVARRVERYKNGLMDLDDYADIAALPAVRLSTLTDMAARGALPPAFAQITRARSHLLLWHALTRAQKRQTGKEGVPWAEMTPEQQRLAERSFADVLANYGAVARAAQLAARIRFRVETQESRVWGLRRESAKAILMAGRQGIALALPSREEALRYFQQLDPEIKPEDVKEGTRTVFDFLYDLGGEYPTLSARLFLPTRWKD
jgi:hypothetical protein